MRLDPAEARDRLVASPVLRLAAAVVVAHGASNRAAVPALALAVPVVCLLQGRVVRWAGWQHFLSLGWDGSRSD
jgi:hypothetical protein